MQSRSARVHPSLQAPHSAGWLGLGALLLPDSDSRSLSSKQQRALVHGVAQLQHTVPPLTVPPMALTELGPIQKFSC